MATDTMCRELLEGLNIACIDGLTNKYNQEAVLINFNHVDKANSKVGTVGAECDYTVQMILKAGKSGVRFKLPDNGSSIFGAYSKSTNDYGLTQYIHTVQLLIVGSTREVKCILDKLDRGRYVAALQTSDGTVEIFGFANGIYTGDYTYNIQEGNGGSLITLQSSEKSQESRLPMVYKSTPEGNEDADFNELFAQP